MYVNSFKFASVVEIFGETATSANDRYRGTSS